MAGQASGNHGQNAAGMFGALQTPVGDWFVDQFVFVGSSTEPIHRTGRLTSRTLIGGAAILAIIEVPTSGARFAMLVTFNPSTDQYELALVDANSEMGVGLLVSKPQNQRAPADVRARFGKAATVIREWTVAQTGSSLGGTAADVIVAVMPVASSAEGLTEGAGGGSVLQGAAMRIVEILVSRDRWLLQFFITGSRGERFVSELVCTRIQPSCHPQLGCEIGCAGLAGCATGCEGFQSPNGVPEGQAQPMGQAQLMGQAQRGCTVQRQAQPIGQAQLGCQAQLIGVSQLGCLQPMALPAPVVLAPQLCAPLQPCAPQPVPPPTQVAQPQHPGRPGNPQK